MTTKKLLLLGYLFLITGILSAQNGIYVKNGKIYSACDEELVLRGVNEMFVWSPSDKTGKKILPEIANTGANAVRLVWTTGGSVSGLEELIKNCLKEKMIPIPEMHDATGDFTKLQMILDFWKQGKVVHIINKYEKWIIVNIANEVGNGKQTDAQWAAYYKDAITQLRDAGIKAPLMIDCGSWGANEQNFLNEGNNLLDHDPLHNIIFSVHTYWIDPQSEQGRKARLDTMIAQAKSKSLPFVIGEGPQRAASPWSTYCDTIFPYEYLIQRCQEESVGWLAWSWGQVDNSDCGAPNSVFDITKDGKFGNWSMSFGKEIMMTSKYSINNTSKKPKSMSIGNCGEVYCSPIDLGYDVSICGKDIVQLQGKVSNESSKTLNWFHNGQPIISEGSGISTMKAGVYRLEADSAGKCKVFDEVTLHNKIEAFLIPPPVLCENSLEKLNVLVPTDIVDVSWFYNGTELKQHKDKFSIEISNPGTYKAVFDADNCPALESIQEVTSKFPVINDTTVCKGEKVQLTVKSGQSIRWMNSATSTSWFKTGRVITKKFKKDKTIYVQDASGIQGSVGKKDLGVGVWDAFKGAYDYKLGFTSYDTLTLKSLVVYTNGSGSIRINVRNDAGSVLGIYSKQASGDADTINIGLKIYAGVYFLSAKGSTAKLKFNHNEGDIKPKYPYTYENKGRKIISVDRTDPAWVMQKPWYPFFYNIQFKTDKGSTCAAKPVNIKVKECD